MEQSIILSTGAGAVTDAVLAGAALASRLQFEGLLAELSARFVNVPDSQVDQEIERAQELLCQFLDVQRCSLWQPTADGSGTFILTHFYQAPGSPPIPQRPEARALFPWALERIRNRETVVIDELSALPPKAQKDLSSWRTYGTKSCLAFPLTTGGSPVFGALAFDILREERPWRHDIVKRLQLIVEVFANALARKRAHQQMLQAAEQWRVTFDAIQDPVMILDPSLRIRQANVATSAFLGMSMDEVRDRSCHKLFHDTECAVEGCPSEKALRTQQREEAEIYVESKKVWLQVVADPVKDAEGNVTGIVHTVRNITALRLSEQDVKELRTRHETLTPREMEVFARTVLGQPNKQIGVGLGITERTVKAHRCKVMEKMKAESLAKLVRMAAKLGFQESD